MTISTFLICAAGILGFLIFLALVSKKNSLNWGGRALRWPYYILLCGLGIVGVMTVRNYIYPSEEIFKNTAYHVLQHDGYNVNDGFYLVRDMSLQDNTRSGALWDTKTGEIQIFKDSIRVNSYFEPLYLGNESFQLVNRTIDSDVSKGFTITAQRNNETVFTYTLSIKAEDKTHCTYTSTYVPNINNEGLSVSVSRFNKKIGVGYPLMDIVSQSPDFNLDDDLQQLLEGSLLVREKSGDAKSDLVLVPGAGMYYNFQCTIDDQEIEPRSFTIPYSGSTMFYSGMGKSKTDVIKLSYNEETSKIEIRYQLPNMMKLKDDGGNLFISSSVETILASSKEGGFFYNLFEKDDNINHIDGKIKYRSGSSKEAIVIEVSDAYSLSKEIKNTVRANEEFTLLSRGSGSNHQNQIEWVFKVNDLRATNPLQYSDILLFIWMFLFIVGIRILLDTLFKTRTLSYFELAVYVVFLTLGTVRLILAWRASTFVPTEDITSAVFAKMRRSVIYTNHYLFIPPIVLTLWAMNSKNENVTFDRIVKGCGSSFIKIENSLIDVVPHFNRKRPLFSPYAHIIALYLLAIGVCALLGKISFLARIMNIPVPFALYILFDLWIQKHGEEIDTGSSLFRVILCGLFGIFLFLADAGFTIVLAVYLLIVHGVIGTLVNCNVCKALLGESFWRKHIKGKAIIKFFFSAVFAVLTFFMLKYEGELMIAVFEYIPYILIGIGLLTALVICLNWEELRRLILIKWASKILAIACVISGVFFSNFVKSAANSKAHMRFRAEVQMLPANEGIDSLMLAHEFNSSDITFIMRSAHNQWFINEYIDAGKNLGDKYFKIQPHSNQGSTFTTQTTDLVITRYVYAEHGEKVIVLFLALFLLLVLIYISESKIEDPEHSSSLSAITLIFIVALLVFLSATNRIVFIGQDFPFLSIQSRVTVIFPVILLMLPLFFLVKERVGDFVEKDKAEIKKSKIIIPFVLVLFGLISVTYLKQHGTYQKAGQFDVSRIIANVSERVERLDAEMYQYQLARQNNRRNRERVADKDTLWKYFSLESTELENVLADSLDNKFYSSLYSYFDKVQGDKTNPDELIHMRRRSGFWRLSVNKKHYFISSILKEELPWQGDLLAANTERFFSLTDRFDYSRRIVLDNTTGYERIPLPRSIQNAASNIDVFRFDESFTDDRTPLILISSGQAVAANQFFHIENDDRSIISNGSNDQASTRIKEGDLISIKVSSKGKENDLVAWRYGIDNENYLAKNIWMNGQRKLFYPLGKESMWSYQFANMVSQVYGNNDTYRDSTLRVSIDYDLHKELYNILSKENASRLSLKASTVAALENFKTKSESNMQRIPKEGLYYNSNRNRVEFIGRNADMTKAVNNINKILSRVRPSESMGIRRDVENAIDQTLEKKFDFSAVAIDGNGRIRLLFDHSKARTVDPNNIRYMNKFISDLYKDGDNKTEREVFGNVSLQTIPSGPGSSFKPIAYTAITGQAKLNWNSLTLMGDNMGAALYIDDQGQSKKGTFRYYGGVDAVEIEGHPLSIDNYGGTLASNYLLTSDNLYHSLVIMFGMQKRGEIRSILRPAGSGAQHFPVLSLDGIRYSFNPDVWFHDNKLETRGGIMVDGLRDNFHLAMDKVSAKQRYTNYFGQEKKFQLLYDNAASYKVWTYPETGSLNVNDRHMQPYLRNGFNQMVLGASPMVVTPLQMGTMIMRLASLNSAENITTLNDDAKKVSDYKFFKLDRDWTQSEYLNFYKHTIIGQIGKTASKYGLGNVVRECQARGYHIYAKTGTLNDGRDDASANSRMKHLLVIISDTALENVSSEEDLQNAKYYAVYLSYIGVDKTEFNTNRFEPMIRAIIKSELFEKYMNE